MWAEMENRVREAVAREATVTTASQARFPGDTMPLADRYVEPSQRTACTRALARPAVAASARCKIR